MRGNDFTEKWIRLWNTRSRNYLEDICYKKPCQFFASLNRSNPDYVTDLKTFRIKSPVCISLHPYFITPEYCAIYCVFRVPYLGEISNICLIIIFFFCDFFFFFHFSSFSGIFHNSAPTTDSTT